PQDRAGREAHGQFRRRPRGSAGEGCQPAGAGLNRYYDLATPFSATEYVMAHLGLLPGLGARIDMKYYEAGHMMYVHPPSMAKMKHDLDAFIDSTARP